MENKNLSRAANPEVQRPRMYQPTSDVGRRYIFSYARGIRNTDRAVTDLFSDVAILNDKDGKIYPTPIIWGTAEKAALYVFGEQFVNNERRKEQGLVDRIILPIISLHGTGMEFDNTRYVYHEALRNPTNEIEGMPAYRQEKKPYDTKMRMSKGIPINRSYALNIWTKYNEELSQILEQIYLKFSPIAYISVEGVPWETPVKIEGSANNISEDVADQQVRIFKYSFNLIAETHIAQPIRRDKTVLNITQKFVVADDLYPSEEAETLITQAQEGDTPENLNEGD